MAIAIVGAGLAGLTCAEGLRARGHEVRLFDKGRGPGGRMSTRRADTTMGQVRFDHGAQYLTADHADFARQLERWEQAGHIAEWFARFVDIDADGTPHEAAPKRRFVGIPSMNSLIRAMAGPFETHWSARVISISGHSGAWQLELEGEAKTEGPFEIVLLAIPAEQVHPLLASLSRDMAEEAAAVVSAPSWTAMLAFDAPVGSEFDAARLAAGPIEWAARNASKPGRGHVETWVLQASGDWSRRHLEDAPEAVLPALTAAFGGLVDAPVPIYGAAHRWRYAQAVRPSGKPCRYDGAIGLGTCGDWHLGGKAEHAWLSGRALADEISLP